MVGMGMHMPFCGRRLVAIGTWARCTFVSHVVRNREKLTLNHRNVARATLEFGTPGI